MAGGRRAVEAVEGLHPERDTYGPMVLVRGTQAQRPAVEQWLAGSNTILVGGELMEIMQVTNYRLPNRAAPATDGPAQRLHEALLRPG
eukprot:12753966-Alexandrium_andersonii.AAC.1